MKHLREQGNIQVIDVIRISAWTSMKYIRLHSQSVTSEIWFILPQPWWGLIPFCVLQALLMMELSFISFEFWTVLFSGSATTLISLYLGEYSSHCNENPIYVFQFWKLRGSSPNFSHSCVCERFIYSHDRSTYLAAAKQTDWSWKNIISHRYTSVGIGR